MLWKPAGKEWAPLSKSMRPSDKKLASALRLAGLEGMAKRAEQGEWNDFFGTHATPQVDLVVELSKRRSREVRIAGHFDATKEEAMQWAQSKEGREVITYIQQRGDLNNEAST